MNTLYKYMRHFVVLGILLFVGACNTEKPQVPDINEEPDKPKSEAIGTYMYDGRQYDILYGVYSESRSYYEFLFSPCDKINGDPINIYLMFTINKGWCKGEKLSFEDLYHNEDYTVVYEDPDHYYSRFKKVVGAFSVLPSQESGRFALRLDAILADGKALSIDFDGVLENGVVSEQS